MGHGEQVEQWSIGSIVNATTYITLAAVAMLFMTCISGVSVDCSKIKTRVDRQTRFAIYISISRYDTVVCFVCSQNKLNANANAGVLTIRRPSLLPHVARPLGFDVHMGVSWD